MTLQEAARFYDCTDKELEYYMRLGGSDPRKFIPDSKIDFEILDKVSRQAENIIEMAQNASCLEDQSPSDFFSELCKKIMTWKRYQELCHEKWRDAIRYKRIKKFNVLFLVLPLRTLSPWH